MIEIRKLSAGYRGDPVLKDLTLSFPKGKISTLIGPNGCGKSTLLKTMCALLPRMSGELLYDGKPLSQFSRREFSKLCAVLPQSRNIPALRAMELVAHGRYPHLSFSRNLREKDWEKVEAAMEKTGTLALKDRLLSSLSGGERQRVYLAMTLAQDTPVLFLDEPTTYLDIGQKYEILELVKGICEEGKTIVMVLHDLPLAFSYSDVITVLEQGKALCQGPCREVFDQKIADRVFGVSSEKVTVRGHTEYLFFKAP